MTEIERLYREYFQSVYRYVYTLCGDEFLAEEITQEAFYKALNKLEQYSGKSSLYVWLCQIAKNTYFSFVRKRKRFVPESEIPSQARAKLDLEGQIIDRETALELQKFLEELHPPYQEVFSLRVFGVRSFAEIGRFFGKSEGWARVIYFRAKKEVRRKWDERSL